MTVHELLKTEAPLEVLKSTRWVLPRLSNSWITSIIWLYIALNRTRNIDCYWVGAVPKVIVLFWDVSDCSSR